MFWIVVYCLHAGRCYVSQDIPGPGLAALPHRYATEQACQAEIPDGKPDPDPTHPRVFREIKKGSECVAVTDVSCINGGSICPFVPADSTAAEKLKSMVTIPR